ncbi:putative lipid II flippase FtsW [Cellulomonas triticagri]|uniref:Probable peptidoglycan glycosyltransferase FtsW n=1 Tax=Cellulomonas triticagri TaxID=2483352 RepID=A0A3M2J935_9CELL|nr:putative lipid II flippase FtsW [Cellulomonas triticagri]RMI08646.1 putative lipid II flippase FtsW [Cellulomonas triticagri]
MAQTTDAPAPDAAPPGRSRLGQWNSAVTSYYLLLGATLLLLVIGLVMVLSSSSVESLADGGSPYAVFLSQAQFALIGLPLMWLASRVKPTTYQRFAWPLLGAGVVLQLLVFTPLGRSKGGNTGWIYLPGFSAQPSEALKLALAVWLGMILVRKQPLFDDWKHAAIPALPIAAGTVGLVLLGRDLGTAMIMLILVAGALFVAGVPMRIFAGAGLLAGVAVAVMAIGSDNRTARILNHFSGDCDEAAGCYQTKHGLQAMATGGWGGLGLGASREKWSYLPEAHNDFIFAIIGEELGLIGTLLVLALFGVLAFAMIRIIARHRDPFAQIVTGAVAAWIIGQALVNMGVVIGLVPVIGVPLPLVSAGGSALITTLVALGVVLSFARTEPGAAEALAGRPSVVRRSLAVIGRTRA